MPNVSYLTKPLTQNKVTNALTTEKEKIMIRWQCARAEVAPRLPVPAVKDGKPPKKAE